MKLLLAVFVLLTVSTCCAQSAGCESTAHTVSCEDSEGNVTYVICSGQFCTSGSYRMTADMRHAVVELVYKPMFHRDALCGADDPTGELFPTQHKFGERVRDPLLPKKNCVGISFVGSADKGYLDKFEKNVYGLCAAKKLNEQQCGVLAREIQLERKSQ